MWRLWLVIFASRLLLILLFLTLVFSVLVFGAEVLFTDKWIYTSNWFISGVYTVIKGWALALFTILLAVTIGGR